MVFSLLPERPASVFFFSRAGRKICPMGSKCVPCPFLKNSGGRGIFFFNGIFADSGTCSRLGSENKRGGFFSCVHTQPYLSRFLRTPPPSFRPCPLFVNFVDFRRFSVGDGGGNDLHASSLIFFFFVFSSFFRAFRVMNTLIKKESNTPNRKAQSQIKDLLR